MLQLIQVQNELDSKNPITIDDSDIQISVDISADDVENHNFHLAKKEFVHFERYKKQKYLPSFKLIHRISSVNYKGKVILKSTVLTSLMERIT